MRSTFCHYTNPLHIYCRLRDLGVPRKLARKAAPFVIPLLITTALVLTTTPALPWSGTVSQVHDGDTVRVDGVRIRLAGIDAPELHQDGGVEATAYLSSLLLGKRVNIEELAKDRYGRTVAWIKVEGALEDVEADMVRTGNAWVYRAYCKHCERLLLLEEVAKAAGRGLWAKADPTPPWQWRKTRGR